MLTIHKVYDGLPRWLSDEEFACRCRSLGFTPLVKEDPLEKEMATHSSILAWKIPLTEEGVSYSPWVTKDLMTKEQQGL